MRPPRFVIFSTTCSARLLPLSAMNWLITVDAHADLQTIAARLAEVGCTGTENLSPIPLDDEQVIEVSGPPELPSTAQTIPGIRKISPSSEMMLY